jgi:hypothetical protein
MDSTGVDIALSWQSPAVTAHEEGDSAQNAFPIDRPKSLRLGDGIGETGAISAFHFGADTPYTTPEGFEAVARRYPEWPILGVHTGGEDASYLQAEETYPNARALGVRCPTVRFILSAKRDTSGLGACRNTGISRLDPNFV